MGDFAKDTSSAQQKQKGQVAVDTGPWAPQQSYLKDIFGKAQQTYDKISDPYTGDMVAGFTPDQLNTFQQMLSYGGGEGRDLATAMSNYGTNLADAGQGAVNYGLTGLQNFNPNDTAGTIADAGMYADNPYMSSMVDAAMRDANRATYEENIPQVRRQAALSGNTNSSRTGAREAILERGNQDRAADISAQLRGSAYGQGIDAAQRARQMELARLGDVSSQGTNASALGGAQIDNSVATMRDLFGLQQTAGEGQRAAEQATIDNQYAKWLNDQNQQWSALKNYYDIVGANQWGSKGTTSSNQRQQTQTETNPSIATILGGVLTGAGAMMPGNWGTT